MLIKKKQTNCWSELSAVKATFFTHSVATGKLLVFDEKVCRSFTVCIADREKLLMLFTVLTTVFTLWQSSNQNMKCKFRLRALFLFIFLTELIIVKRKRIYVRDEIVMSKRNFSLKLLSRKFGLNIFWRYLKSLSQRVFKWP